MATIVDFQIRELARTRGLVEPYEPAQQNPASYDVRLGGTILVEQRASAPGGAEWRTVDISEEEYLLQPGEFVLAHTKEFVRVPVELECIFQLKSSRGREGYEHALAGYIDPGFHGQVTLELTNLRRYKALPLKAGLLIGQLRFSRVDEVPHRPYSLTGRYNNDKGVQASKG
jgi:dCTP deaminase